MQHLENILATLKVAVTIHHNGQYCGAWNVDTSGTHFINFHVISHGYCYLRSNANSTDITRLNEGDLVIFPSDSQHCLSNDRHFTAPINQSKSSSFDAGELPDATGLLCGYFSYQHPIMNNVVQQLPEIIILRHNSMTKNTLLMLINALIVEAKSSGASDNWMLNKIAESVMALLFTQHLSGNQGILAGLAHPKLQPALNVILENPQQKWTVDALAKCCFMSRTAFSNTFHRVMAMTPIEFVTYWRLSVAYHQLLGGEHSTLEVALNTGYDNESSFSKAFKRVMGMSPGAVKNESPV